MNVGRIADPVYIVYVVACILVYAIVTGRVEAAISAITGPKDNTVQGKGNAELGSGTSNTKTPSPPSHGTIEA